MRDFVTGEKLYAKPSDPCNFSPPTTIHLIRLVGVFQERFVKCADRLIEIGKEQTHSLNARPKFLQEVLIKLYKIRAFPGVHHMSNSAEKHTEGYVL